MNIGKTRGFLYWLSRLLGTVRLIRQPDSALWSQNLFGHYNSLPLKKHRDVWLLVLSDGVVGRK